MRPPLPTERGNPALHLDPPRDATERRRRVLRLVSVGAMLQRRPDLAADVDLASAWRFLRAEGAVLEAHLDAEQEAGAA